MVRHRLPLGLVTALGLGVLGLSLAGGATGQARTAGHSNRGPSTLLSTNRRITALAQDGGRIAWMSVVERGKCGEERHPLNLQILTLRTKRTVTIPRVGCRQSYGGLGVYDELAFAGDRALWKELTGVGNTEVAIDVHSASLHDQRVRTIGSLVFGKPLNGYGPDPPLAGRGDLLVFYFQAYEIRRVERVVGHTAVSLFDVTKTAGPPIDLAVDRNRIAVLRANGHSGTLVQVHAASGAPLGTFRSKAEPRDLAIAGRLVAVLTHNFEASQQAIRLFEARSGASRGTIHVSLGASDLVASGHWLVFRTGNAIRLLDTRSRKISVAAIVKGTPIGLSVSGKRVAWAEILRGGSRIRSLILPAG
jgi:hypothetical protein